MNKDDVAQFFLKESKARSTINSIRKPLARCSSNNTRVKSTKDLTISDDMKTILLDGKKCAFLQYDNESKVGNRILIFFSDQASDILKLSIVWCIDGTFKYSPKIFYQIITLTSIYKNEPLHCVFMLVERKTYETYLEALQNMKSTLYMTYNSNVGL